MSQVAAKDLNARVGERVTGLRVRVDGLAERLRREIDLLAHTVGDARAEIAGLGPNALARVDLPDAAGRLSAIASQGEQAAMRIMDAAEELLAVAATLDDSPAARVRAVATTMFEASSFHDITGQHVSRVLEVLGTIEDRLRQLATLVGDNVAPAAAPPVGCSGPATGSNGNDQIAVDRLLGSTG